MRDSFKYYDSSTGSIFNRGSKREFLLFLFAGILVLVGCYRMAKAGSPEVSENLPDFLFGAGIASFGFFISWFNSRRWSVLVIGVAVIGRLLFLPSPVSEDLSRRMWEGEVLDAGFNPYVLSPEAEELSPLREKSWERIEQKSETSHQTPFSLALFRIFSALGFNAWTIKFVFIVMDLWICVMLIMRYGSQRSVLYAWNPLALYCVAGGGHLEAAMILPALGGFLIWDAWVDRKGGAVVINANGGLGGGLGQMVCFAAFLIGTAAALNLIFLPIVVWMAWHVLSKSGIRSGLAILLVGLIPMIVFSGWGALSLGLELRETVAFSMGESDYSLSLIPKTLERMGIEVAPDYYLWAALVVALVLMLRNESMERFSNLYIGSYLVLSVFVFPWHFLWLAPFALGAPHVGFRWVSITAFFGYLVYSEEVAGQGLVAWQAAALWTPFLLGVIWYALTHRTQESGFYVKSY